MREIKFRIWDVRNGRYIYAYDMDIHGKWIHVAEGDQLYYVNSEEENLHEFTLEQYTGLKDKKGNEIYEGDVVLFDNLEKFLVGWFDETASFELFDMTLKTCLRHLTPFKLYFSNKLEVIGNI